MLLILLLISSFLHSGNDAVPIVVPRETSLASAVGAPIETRSVYNIVWSCLATTLLCAWTTMHLDTTHSRSGSTQWVYRILLLLASVIMPEYVVGWAMSQRKMAQEIQHTYKDRGWTMVHAHLLEMGGFALCYPEAKNEMSVVEDAVVEQRFIEKLSFGRFNDLLKESSITFPTITECEIRDRAKTDGLAKLISALQTLWFVIQCFARHIEKLAITELELTTLALASLNWLTLWFWRDKPQNVMVPVPVYLVEGSPEWYRRKAARDPGLAGVEKKQEALEISVKEVGLQETAQEPSSPAEWKRRKIELEEQMQWFQRESQWINDELKERSGELRRRKAESQSSLARLFKSTMPQGRSMSGLWRRLQIVRGLGILITLLEIPIVAGMWMALAGLMAIPLAWICLALWIVKSDSDEKSWICIRWKGSFPEIRVDRPDSYPRITIVFPRSFPGKDYLVVEDKQEGTLTDTYTAHSEMMAQCVHSLNYGWKLAGRHCRSWWSSASHPRSWRYRPGLFLRIFLVLFVLLPVGIPLVGIWLILCTILGIATSIPYLMAQFQEFCAMADMHLTTRRISDPDTGQNQVWFYSKIVLYKPFDLFSHISHFVAAELIGTFFGALHCLAWYYSYPTRAEQLMWRIAASILTVTPTVFFSVSWPAMIIHGPLPPVVLLPFVNSLGLLFLVFLVARLTIIGLAFVLLRQQPETAYFTVTWTNLFPHPS